MELAMLLAIGQMIAQYGVPAAMSIISLWEFEGDITKQDIDRLKRMVPKPGTYFKEV